MSHDTGQGLEGEMWAPVCSGWSRAGPELRGQVCYNPVPMATGQNLLPRQNVHRDVLAI